MVHAGGGVPVEACGDEMRVGVLVVVRGLWMSALVMGVLPMLALAGAYSRTDLSATIYRRVTHPASVCVSHVLALAVLYGEAYAPAGTATAFHYDALADAELHVVVHVIVAMSTLLLVNLVLIALWPSVVLNSSVRLSTSLVLVCLLSYASRLVAPSPYVYDFMGRRMLLLRFLVWDHTMPMMTTLLNTLADDTPQRNCWRIFQTYMCIQLGLYGTLPLPIVASLVLLAISQFCLTHLSRGLIAALRAADKNSVDRNVVLLGAFVVVGWHVFPVIWLAAELGFIDSHAELVLYSVSDVIAKAFVTMSIVQAQVKHASEALHRQFHTVQAERRMMQDDLRAMIAVSGVPIIVTDASATVTVWNRRCAALSHIEPAVAEGRQVWDLPKLTDKSRREAYTALRTVLVSLDDAPAGAGQARADSSSVTFQLEFELDPNEADEGTVASSTDHAPPSSAGAASCKATLLLITASVTRDGAGLVTGLICLGADMTAECDFLLAEASRAHVEALNDSKDKFLAIMSHEMRTPLSALIGMLQLATAQSGTQYSREELSTQLEHALRSAEHLFMLVCDVLDMSKVQHGQFVLSEAEFAVRDTIAIVASHCRRVLLDGNERKQNVSFTVDISENVPKTVLGDGQRIQQILTNLVSNGIKYTKHGSVTINVRTWLIDPSDPGYPALDERARLYAPRRCVPRTLSMCVRDTGVGIPKSALEHVFQLFGTVPGEAVNTMSVGMTTATGIGLTVCKELVDAMGGTLTVDSRPGVGTAFTFELDMLTFEDAQPQTPPLYNRLCGRGPTAKPAALSCGAQAACTAISQASEAAAAAASAAEPPSSPGANEPRPLRVLLVEDDDMNRIVVSMFLKGNVVLEAHNGLEAIVLAHHELAAGRYLDLVLMDLNMPVLDGRQASRILRLMQSNVTPWAAELPVLALTANALHAEHQKCLDVGMTSCLTKPVAQKDINSLVRQCQETASRLASTRRPVPDGPLPIAELGPMQPLLCELVTLVLSSPMDPMMVRLDLPQRSCALLGLLAWALKSLGLTDAWAEVDALWAQSRNLPEADEGMDASKLLVAFCAKHWKGADTALKQLVRGLAMWVADDTGAVDYAGPPPSSIHSSIPDDVRTKVLCR